MGWKDWPSWLRWGLSFVSAYLILLIISIPLKLTYIASGTLASLNSGGVNWTLWQMILFDLIFWFIIGAIIGWIIGKIKNR